MNKPLLFLTDAAGNRATTEMPSSVIRNPVTVPPLGDDIDIHKHLDTSRVQAIARLFDIPGQHGIDVFTCLLACALLTPEDTPTMPAEAAHGKYAALLSVESLHVLSKLIKRSYETTQKYVTLFCTCGLIARQKIKHSRRVYLAFPAGPYVPPLTLLADLDALLARSSPRPKVKSLVRQVRERCIAHAYVSGKALGLEEEDVTDSLQHILTALQSEQEESTSRIAKATTMLTNLLSAIQATHLQGRKKDTRSIGKVDASVVDALSNRGSTSLVDFSRQEGDVRQRAAAVRASSVGKSSSLVDAAAPTRNGPTTASLSLVDARQPAPTLTVVESTPQVDVTASMYVHLATTSPAQGDARQRASLARTSVTLESPTEVDANVSATSKVEDSESKSGDSDESEQCLSLTESPQEGKVGRREHDHLSSNLLDLSHRGDSDSALRNVDVSNVYNFITSTLREPQRVAEFLAEQLEGDRRVSPKYHKLFSVLEGHPRDPHVLAAAFLCTMVRLHRDRWTITRPGGFFTTRCREYDASVPEEVEGWISRYGHLSLAAFYETLAKEREARSGPPPGKTRPAPSPGKPAPKPLLPPLALSPETRVEQARVTMSKEEAQALARAIVHDPRTQLFRAVRLRGGTKEAPRYAVLVDASIPGGLPHQTVVYSPIEWQARLDRRKTWHDLISPFACDPPSSSPTDPTRGGGEPR